MGSLSQIENGRGNPSLALLGWIAGALNVDAGELLSAPPASATAIVRNSERPHLRLVHDEGEVDLLTPGIRHDLTVSRSVLAPGESVEDTGYSGEICILVQRGRKRLETETGEVMVLGPGDAVSYTIPRAITRSNVGRGPLELIGVFSPGTT